MHSVSEIITSLTGAGLALETFLEHPVCRFKYFPFLVEAGDGFRRVPDGFPDLPLSFTMRFRR